MATSSRSRGGTMHWHGLIIETLLFLPALSHAMIFTPSPDKAGHMRSNWDNWYVLLLPASIATHDRHVTCAVTRCLVACV